MSDEHRERVREAGYTFALQHSASAAPAAAQVAEVEEVEEEKVEALRFLTPELTRRVRAEYGTPVYVYSEAKLRANASQCLAFPNVFGLTVRFAMKACPNSRVLRIFESMGLHIDASSGYEVKRALLAGFSPGLSRMHTA
jgi:diaminopimelate decarboxylase